MYTQFSTRKTKYKELTNDEEPKQKTNKLMNPRACNVKVVPSSKNNARRDQHYIYESIHLHVAL